MLPARSASAACQVPRPLCLMLLAVEAGQGRAAQQQAGPSQQCQAQGQRRLRCPELPVGACVHVCLHVRVQHEALQRDHAVIAKRGTYQQLHWRRWPREPPQHRRCDTWHAAARSGRTAERCPRCSHPNEHTKRCPLPSEPMTRCSLPNERMTRCTLPNERMTRCTLPSGRMKCCTLPNEHTKRFTLPNEHTKCAVPSQMNA